MELTADKVNVDLESGSVIITGFIVEEIITELGHEELLSAMDYSDVKAWVAQQEQERADEEADMEAMIGMGK